ncbi:hypothetical protein H6P81_004550 [Aristolochia fimbriata]|uniref:protein-histidine N-methyltransferase n=1 Tax=Aristolochia fimbriata TaxID=158543 RepID=A0AAV7FFP6_ARIFI|nr:hypothetical protein H6P81_004550 [Aristolochia fimbriata]
MAESSQPQENSALDPFRFFSMPDRNPPAFAFGFFGSTEQQSLPLPPPPPCQEVFPEKVPSFLKSTIECVNLNGGITLLKGKVSAYEVFGVPNSDLLPGKYEGGLKLWEGSLDLIKILHSELRDGHLSLTGKKVLELGCGHGLPGIFTSIEGAAVIHFQDFNAEVLRCLTIPNVKANLPRSLVQGESSHKFEADANVSSKVRFFAGDWSEVHNLLLPVSESTPNASSKQGHQSDGYDVILMAETVYSVASLKSLYGLMKKCLRSPDGVVYLSAKKHYFGVGGGTRQFCSLVEEDGAMASCLVAEVADGSSNVREVWKFSYRQ